ncbi:hypothetical protein IFR05_014467 [Cadophora sp. M221]|nr:hypothetical protein IFR05_014467 [Cadophora sp. M221]
MATQPAVDNTALYDELMNYDWDGDEVFQGGLRAIRGPNPPPTGTSPQTDDLTLHAQIFYFSRKKSTAIDFNSYKEYLLSKSPDLDSQQSSTAAPSSRETATNTTLSTSQSESPSIYTPTSTTQATSPPQDPTPAPNMAVGITPSDPSSFSAPTPGAQPGAPYPRSFAEIVALIQSGAPIPGIKEFDDTPMGLAASSPSVLPKRRKPWEKDVPEEIIQGRGPGTFGDHRDNIIQQEYPDA